MGFDLFLAEVSNLGASPVLARWLSDRGRGLRIAPSAFASGSWVRGIPALLGLGRQRESFPDGARQAADLILEKFGAG